METRSRKEWLIRLFLMVCGLAIAHLGVSIFMMVGLGADPFNLFIQGLVLHFSITHGMVHLLVSFGIVLLLLILDRRSIRASTLFGMVLCGPMIDLFVWMFGRFLNKGMYFPVRLLLMTAASLILAFGIAIMVQTETGNIPSDQLVISVGKRLQQPFQKIRLSINAVVVAAGILLGGNFGIGTLVCVFVVGIAVNFFMPVSGQLIRRMLLKYDK